MFFLHGKAGTPWVWLVHGSRKTHVLLCRIWSLYVKWYGDPREKSGPRVPPFRVTQGHRNWHGSILIQIDQVSMISCQWSVATMGLPCTVSDFVRNLELFPYPAYLTPHWRGCPWSFVSEWVSDGFNVPINKL